MYKWPRFGLIASCVNDPHIWSVNDFALFSICTLCHRMDEAANHHPIPYVLRYTTHNPDQDCLAFFSYAHHQFVLEEVR